MYVFLNSILASGDNGRHLAGDIKEVYWGSAAFFILLGLIVWKGGPKIKELMNKRTESIRTEIYDSEKQKTEAMSALHQSAGDMPDLGQERSRIRKEALDTAKKLKTDLGVKAVDDAKAIVAKGQSDCENLRRQASADLATELAAITRDTTEAVVINDIDSQTQIDLIDSYIDNIGQMV